MLFTQFKHIYVISPLLAEMQRRDDIFMKQARFLRFQYKTHTGPIESRFLKFTHEDSMIDSIYTSSPNTWESKGRAALVTQAHLDVIRFHIESGYTDHLCIFENDVLFHKDFHKIFNESWKEIPDDFEIVYMGGHHSYKGSVWTDQKTKRTAKMLYGSLCSHAYILSHKACKKIIDSFDKNLSEGRFLIIDQLLENCTTNENISTYCIFPKLVEQGYCGTPSLTMGLEQEQPEEFDYSDVYVREPHFDSNKASNAVKEDYTNIIHMFSSKAVEEISKQEAKRKLKIRQEVDKKIKSTEVHPDVYEKRMSICNSCDRFKNERCELCGCKMEIKNRHIATKCPDKKF